MISYHKCCSIGWTTYNSWLAFWQSFKGFYWPKRDEKMYKKVPIFRCTTPSTGKRLKEFEVVVGTLFTTLHNTMLVHYTLHYISVAAGFLLCFFLPHFDSQMNRAAKSNSRSCLHHKGERRHSGVYVSCQRRRATLCSLDNPRWSRSPRWWGYRRWSTVNLAQSPTFRCRAFWLRGDKWRDWPAVPEDLCRHSFFNCSR